MTSLAVVVMALVARCLWAQSPTPAVHPDILIVLAGAQDLQYTKVNDGAVSYRLAEPYPGDATIGQVRSRLEAQGWKPVSDDLFNPGLTNSLARGWVNFIDGTRDDANVFLWNGAWESTRGDRVEYSFQYTYARDSGPMSEKPALRVMATYMTAPTVNVLREYVRRQIPPAAENR